MPGLTKIRSGKVREIFDLDESLLFIATDRISAFDCVLPDPIPCKGEVLTQLSHFWFDRLEDIVPNHRLNKAKEVLPANLAPYSKRAMVVKKAAPLSIECIVRGYLAGSGWKEYKKSKTVCGAPLPDGLLESSELPEPIFTPSTKAETGHDENISFEKAKEIVGETVAEKVRDYSLKLYSAARDLAKERGIIIADTKFEFGIFEGQIILIDEALTPDSSRFWPLEGYEAGKSQPSFDKQGVRDYLETLDWNKQNPAPNLPKEIIEKTTGKYLEAFRLLTGRDL